MLQVQELIRLLAIENDLIHSQTEGLTQADTLIQPQPSGNCMNWVLGHLLDNQLTLLKLLGGQAPFDPARVELYRRNSQPVTAAVPGVLSLQELLDGHDAVHAGLAACLSGMSDADFDRPVTQGERTYALSWRVLFLHFHYTYHLGQLELLRQLAGKTDKII